MSGAKFGTAQDVIVKSCAICGDDVKSLDNRLVVEKETLHQTCFKCSFCDNRLQMGYCVIDINLYDRFGPCWYCTLICAQKPTNEKVSKLLEKGRKPRVKSTAGASANKSPSPQPPPVQEQAAQQPKAEPPKGPTEKGPLLNVFSAIK